MFGFTVSSEVFSVRRNRRFLAALALSVLSFACGKAEMNCDSESGRAAIVKAVDDALNTRNCAKAIETIDPFYEKPACGTDEIRFARAAAYACLANVSFFQLISDLSSASLTGAGLWDTIARFFPSTPLDSKVTAAEYALDTLFAIRRPGSVTPPQYLIEPGSLHEGTVIPSHRTSDSNIYGIFTSMALMGALQNRYGAPDGAHQKTQALGKTAGNPDGWMKATAVDEDACAYAGATLTMLDNIGEVGSLLGSAIGGGLGTVLGNVGTTFTVAMDLACEAGCTDSIGITGCTFAAGECGGCPRTLRYRKSCDGAAKNKEACAAAGLIYYINTSPLGWQGPL